MALVLKDRVRETTTTQGTGTVTLAGAVAGFQSFSAIGDANTTYYTINLPGVNEWEVGIGTYTASGTTLSRDTVLSSSNSGNLVNFSAGTKDVFCTYPAGRSVYYDTATNVTLNTLAATTIDTTNLEVTNVKAKDGTASITLADSTGNVTVSPAFAVNGNTTLGDASTDTVTVNGYMGVGGAVSSTVGLNITASALTSVNQWGAFSGPTGTSAATALVAAYGADPKTAAAVFTCTDVIGYQARDADKGAGSTITNQHGLYIANQTQGTNNYGITSLVSSGSNKWNIYASGTAANYFAGDVGVGTTPSSTFTEGGGAGKIQVGVTSGGAYTAIRASNNVSSTSFSFLKSRGASVGTNTAVISGDSLGQLNFGGADGTNYLRAAQIEATVGGTVSTGVVPGKLSFLTANTSGTNTERLSLSTTEAVINDPGNDYDFRVESDTNTHALFVDAGNSRVGVNMSDPGDVLHVQGASSTEVKALTLRNEDSTTNAVVTLGFEVSAGTPGDAAALAGQIKGIRTGSGTTGDLAFWASNSGVPAEVARVTSNKYVRLASGTGGIQFNGDTAAANALDDYEEGSWTPVFADATSGGNTATYTSAGGTYTKIGRIVHYTWFVSNIDTSGMTGANDLVIRGLPFASTSSGFSIASIYANQLTQTANYTTFNAYISTGVSYSLLIEVGNNNSSRNVTVSQCASGTADIRVSGTYQV